MDILAMIDVRRNAGHTGRHGFTLVEITLVLLALASLAGLVAGGGTMIENARLRKQMTQLEDVQSTVQNFRTKFNCYPGDCSDPTVISGAGTAGDGSGYLPTSWNSTEARGFWAQLVQSNLLNEVIYSHPFLSGLKVPLTKAGNPAGIHVYGSSCYAQNVMEIATMTSSFGSFSTTQIAFIDGKSDDGKPNSGSIRSSGFRNGSQAVFAGNPIFPLSSSNNNGSSACIIGDSYNTSAALGTCNLIYIMESP